MSVIPASPPLAKLRPVNAVDSWPVRQRGSPPAGGTCPPGVARVAAVPAAGNLNAAAAAALGVAFTAGPATAWPPGLLAAQAATTRAEPAPATAAARPRASGLPPGTEIFTVSPVVL